MSSYLKIYNLRQDKLPQQRQPRHINILKELNSMLEKRSINHPYKLERADREGLMSRPSYSSGSRGLDAKNFGKKYIYRISSVGKLYRNVTRWKSKRKHDRYKMKELFDLLMQIYNYKKKWLFLGDFAEGFHSNPRNFTFWTTFDLTKNFVKSPSKLGLVYKSISPWPIILRCPTDNVKKRTKTFVPTVIDAFDSPIFHPTKDIEKPELGITINIGNKNRLSEGTAELVLGSINVDYISFKPIQISSKERINNFIKLDSSLLALLEDYYNNL